jgi:hypothetical protein
MVVYECPRCGYTTNLLPNLRNHLERKKICSPKKSNLSIEQLLEFYDNILQTKVQPKLYCCETCNKEFKSPQSKYQHKQRCTIILSSSTSSIQSIESQHQQLMNQNKILQEQIDELKKQVASSSTQNISNITINNNTVNNYIVNIRAFGNENIAHIEKDKEFLTNCLFAKDIKSLVENIHGDKDYPENHNIRILSDKKERMEIMGHQKVWLVASKDEALGDLINNCYSLLRRHGYFNKKEIIAEGDYDIDDYENAMDWLEDVYSNEKIRKPIKDKLYILFLNIARLLKANIDDDNINEE